MKNPLTIVVIGLLIVSHSFAQPYRLENYRHLLTEKEKIKGFKQDTGYINLLLKFSTSFYAVNPDSMQFYCQKAYGYAKDIHYEHGEAESLSINGYFYSLMGDYSQMLSYYQQAQTLAEKVNDRVLAANMIRNIARLYVNTGKTEEALRDFKKAYGIMQGLKDSVGQAYLLVDIASVYYVRHDYDKVLELYQQAMQVLNDPNGYAAAFIRVDIGSALCEKKQYKDALACFEPSLQYYQRTSDKLGRMNTTGAMAGAYGGLGQTDKGISYALESFSLANELKHKEGMVNAGECLANLYEKKGDYRSSLKYFKLYKGFSDSLFNEDTRKKTADQQARFIYEKKEALLKQKQDARVRVLHFEIAIALVSILLLGTLIICFFYPQWLRQFSGTSGSRKGEEVYEEKKITYL